MPSAQKQQQVAAIINRLNSVPHFAVVSFGKASHKSIEALRKKLREAMPDAKESPLQILKNSLFRIAVKKLKKESIIKDDVLIGPSALLSLPKDWTTVLKIFHNYGKGDENFSFKVGVIDNNIYIKDQLVRLAQLPSREQLVAKIIAALKSPSTRLVYSMNFNLTKLIYILKQKSTARG